MNRNYGTCTSGITSNVHRVMDDEIIRSAPALHGRSTISDYLPNTKVWTKECMVFKALKLTDCKRTIIPEGGLRIIHLSMDWLIGTARWLLWF